MSRIPDPGEYFLDGYGHLCQMKYDLHFDKLFPHKVSNLIYINLETSDHCAKKILTKDELNNYQIGDMDMQSKDTTFTVTLENGHNTYRGLDTLEAAYIEHVLKLNKYNQVRTAIALSISRGCLRMKLKKYFADKYV